MRYNTASVVHALNVLVLTLMLVACGQQQPADGLHEGQLFPPLKLTGLDRPDITIDDLRGRWLVLNVWATWCGPCRKELGSLQQLSQHFSRDKLQVIGLNVDADVHVAREFMRDEGVSIANYTDPDMTIAQTLLGIRTYPDTFIIAPDGTLWRSISGERDWISDTVTTALEQALAGHTEALSQI